MDDKGFIDLGVKYGDMETAKVAEVNKKAPKVSYPTLYINSTEGADKGLDELPDGEFEFTGRARIASYKEDIKNNSCSCELEIMAIRPNTKKEKAKKSKTAEESLDEAITEVAKKKASKASK